MLNKTLQLFTFIYFCSILSSSLIAQNWGNYTLIATQNSTTAKLINHNGSTYKSWSLTGQTGYSSYLLPNRVLLRTVRVTGASFNGGGICGRIQKVDWNGNLLWDYTLSNTTMITHHDVEPMPNGNVLVIAYEKKTSTDLAAVGYSGSQTTLWSEAILELQPNGTNGATVVWEWHLWDHLVQNVNSALSNYGVPNQHPELLNINYNSNTTDWVHANGIDYNANTNQIVFSSHNLNEVYIIDHSTSTAQAASHSGGNSGKGGDFLYRWGNPAAYGGSGVTFNVIHDAHWIPDGIPNAGDIVVFHNNGGSGQSSVDRFTPNFAMSGGVYLPTALSNKIICNGYSSNMGNSQSLANGNTLYCVATQGTIGEANSSNTTFWTYNAGGVTPQATRYDFCYVNGNPTGTATAASTSLCPGKSTTLTITPDITASYTYTWSSTNGFSSTTQNPTITPTSSGTYTVIMDAGNGCTGTASVTVNLLSAPSANAGADVTISQGQSTPLTASGGTSYVWNTGQNTASITVNPSATTTYTVTVTGAGSCTATDQVTVYVSAAPVSVIASATQSTICNGASTQLNATPSGGTGSNTYNWSSNPSGFNSSTQNPTVSPTITTTYTVTVTNGANTSTSSVTINVNALPNANAGVDVTITQGQSTTLTASGGTSFIWNTGQNNASITVNPSATTTYTVTVTDANGCKSTDNVVVTVNLPAVVASATTTNATICTGSSAQLNVSASGGNNTYTYAWSSSPSGFNSSSQNPLVNPTSTTTYTVSVTSINGSSTSNVTIAVIPLPNANAGADVTITFGQSTTLSASGGLTYNWNNGINTQNTTVSPSNTTTYTVTVTDANGCKATDDVVVTVNYPAVVANANASITSICPNSITQLDVNASGGNNSFTYAWSSNIGGFASSQKNPSVAPTQTTIYTVTVTSAGNSSVSSVTINVNPLPNANAGTDVNILIGQSTTLTASGGVSYQWNNGQNTQSITVNPSTTTTYVVTVTDANGCKATDEVVVFINYPAVNAVASASQTTICNGTSVQLDVAATGGNGSFTYAWATPLSGVFSSQKSPTVTPSTNTVYNVTVTSINGSTTASVTVIVNQLPNANAGSDVVIIKGNSTTLTASGGGTYLWNTGATTASITVSPSQTTTYSVIVTSSAGCAASDNVLVTVNLPALIVNSTITKSTICSGDSTQIEINASGATGTFSYKWVSTPTGFSSTEKNINIKPTVTTTYTVTVTSGSASSVLNQTITVNPTPVANAGSDVSVQIGNAVNLTASGGTNYLWSNGATTATIEVKPSLTTTYIVTVSNSFGCSSSDQVEVSVKGIPLSVVTSATETVICAGRTIQLKAQASGGTGNSSFTWSSSHGDLTSNIQSPLVSPTTTTIYTVTVSNGGTTVTSSITITVNANPIANAGADVTIAAGQNATLTASGGTKYFWSTKDSTVSIQVNPLETTVYFVTVTNSSGCTATDQVYVNVVPQLVVTISSQVAEICEGTSTTLQVSTSGGLGTQSYQWASNPIGFNSTLQNPTVSPTITTIFFVTVTDGIGSSAVAIYTLKVNPTPIASTISQNKDTLVASITAPSYQWYLGGKLIANATKQKFVPTVDGTYQVEYINLLGCISKISSEFNYTKIGLVDTQNSELLNIYPNPFDNIIHFGGSIVQNDFSVELLNLQGQVIRQFKGSSSISLENLPSGTYILKVQQQDNIYLRRLIKQ